MATFTVRSIIEGQRPILLVCHDEDGWQFLTGDAVGMHEAMIVALKTILRHDPSVSELSDLALGWQAWRQQPGAEWVREPRHEEGAAEQ